MHKTHATAGKHAPAQHPQGIRPASAAEPVPGSSNGTHLPEEEVRLRAYQKWEAAGRPDGDGVGYWLEAEQELLHAE
jgi:Protein of unknown function (DUF2934)